MTTSDNSNESRATSRRRFLRGVAVTGGAAVFAAGAGGYVAGADGDGEDNPTGGKIGYQESEHVREYYRRADF